MSDLLRVVERSKRRPDGGRELHGARALRRRGARTRPRRTPPARRDLASRRSCARPPAPVWERHVAHPFVRGIGDGSLPEDSVPLLRPPGLPVPDRLRAAARRSAPPARRGSSGCVASRRWRSRCSRPEMDLHRQFARALGDQRGGARVRPPPRRPPTRTATSCCARPRSATSPSWSLRSLPCMWSYSEIGSRLAAAGLPDHEGYAEWIAMYASDEFAAARRLVPRAHRRRRRGGRRRRADGACTTRSARRASTSSRSGTAPSRARPAVGPPQDGGEARRRRAATRRRPPGAGRPHMRDCPRLRRSRWPLRHRPAGSRALA